MKMRKIFAILLSTALLMALAIVPANAAAYKAEEFVATEVTDDIAEGTIMNYDVTGNYGEVSFTLTSGSVTVAFGDGTTNALNITFAYTSETAVTYSIRGKGATTIDSAKFNNKTLDTNVITAAAVIEGKTAIVTVNGTEYEIDLNNTALAGTSTLDGMSKIHVWGKGLADGLNGTATVTSYGSTTAKLSLPLVDAEGNPVEDNSTDVDVIVKDKITPDEYIEVVLTMGAFDFTYTPETYKWDAEANQYIEDAAAYWTGNDDANNVITVTNRSSIAVEIEVTNTVPADTNGVEFALEIPTTELAAATDGNEPSVTITGTISGTPDYEQWTTETSVNIGTITVAVYRA